MEVRGWGLWAEMSWGEKGKERGRGRRRRAIEA